MTKQVQRRRGSSTQHTGFTGADGEISVNTTNKSVHVHDGATAGGFEAARADLDNVDSTANLSINNLTVSGTVDGRDVAADGTKLDGIEAAADVTDTANVTAAGALMTTGGSVTGDVSFGDNDKAIFGAGSDLEIYHDAANSRIVDAGTGNLNLQADNNINILNNAGTEFKAQFITNGAVNLFYDNSKKLETTASGCAVTGSITADDLDLDIGTAGDGIQLTSTGANYLNLGFDTNRTGASQTLTQIEQKWNGTAVARISFVTGSDTTNKDDAEIRFQTASAGTPSNAMTVKSDGSVGIGTVSPSAVLDIESTSSTQLELKRSGTAGQIAAMIFKDGGNAQNRISSTSSNLVFGYGASNTEAMRIDGATGNLEVSGAVSSTGTGAGNAAFKLQEASNNPWYLMQFTGGAFSLNYNGTTGGASKFLVDANGNLLLNTTSTSYGGKFTARQTTGNTLAAIACVNTGTSGTRRLIDFFTGTSTSRKGSIESNGTTTSYNETSDYRLKENVTYDWDATTRLKQLKPARFNFISAPDETRDGFLAHELQQVSPQSVTGTKDGMMDEEYQVSAATGDIYTPAVEATYDDDGVELTAAIDEVIHSADVEQPEELAEGQQWRETTAAVMGTRSVPDYQGIDQSKLVPLLVKTIQELEARITALEAS